MGTNVLSSFVRKVGGEDRKVAVEVPVVGLPLKVWDVLCREVALSVAPSDLLVVLPLRVLRTVGVIHGQWCTVSSVNSWGKVRRVCRVVALEVVMKGEDMGSKAFVTPTLAAAVAVDIEGQEMLRFERIG